MPPKGKRGGYTLLADSTGFTTWFGGTARLQHCEHNLAMM
jgi:hypothetical protein